MGAFGLLVACSNSIDDPADGAHSTGGSRPAAGGGDSPGAGRGSGTSGSTSVPGGGTSATAGSGQGGNGSGGDGPKGPASLLPARIRRLANAEYDASVHKLLGTTASPASGSDFPPDFRQNGFTVNEGQRVDSIIVQRLATAAETLAAEAAQNGTLGRLAPCSNIMSQANTCARTFITTFGAKVYRRPLVEEEITALLALYTVGAEGKTYDEGVSVVLRGLLQSAGFLYLTELGNGTPAADGSLALTPNELAATLSYYLTSAPPDDQLLDKAGKGTLSDPAVREAEARRLLANDPLAQESAVRVVREWLGIDRIVSVSKDSTAYPNFEGLKDKIRAESRDFVKAVAFRSTGTISELLGANWTVNSGPVADLYKGSGNGPVTDSTKIPNRIGILNQAAFLSVYANAHESHPVFRGVAVGRRLACLPLPAPTMLKVAIVPPAPDPKKTTRERFDIHSKDEACAGCHKFIDPLGFSFEHFDGMGGYRDKENLPANPPEGLPVDSAVSVTTGKDFDGDYADSNALATALSQSEDVRTCFARFMYRAASASSDASLAESEEAFVEAWRAIPAAAQGNIIETLVAYVKTPSFAARRAQ